MKQIKSYDQHFSVQYSIHISDVKNASNIVSYLIIIIDAHLQLKLLIG